MGGKGYLGIALLLAVLAVGVFVWKKTENCVLPVAQTLDAAMGAARSGQTQEAGSLLNKAKQAWQESWAGLATVADHAPMEAVDALFSQVEQYLQQGLYEDFAALCGRLRVMVEAIAEAHSPKLKNLL